MLEITCFSSHACLKRRLYDLHRQYCGCAYGYSDHLSHIVQFNLLCEAQCNVLFTIMHHSLIQTIFVVETCTRKKSYEKYRRKFRTQFSGTTAPSKSGRSASWPLMTPTPTYSKLYMSCASVIGFLSNYPVRTVQCVRAALNTVALSHAS